MPDDTSLQRINKALAGAGVCSRRKADELVQQGLVKVNGRVVDTPGFQVGPEDRIEVSGRLLPSRGSRNDPCCLMLHKPVSVVSTARDPQGRTTVLDLVPPPWNARRLYPAGRLDFFSEGLVLLTDDGELTHRLIHPSHHLPRVYRVLVRGQVSAGILARMRNGMTLAEGEKLAPVEVRTLETRNGGRRTSGDVWLELVLHQGVNRQIRRMCRDLGLIVLRLIRVAQGPLELGDLPAGRVRPLTPGELKRLRAAAGLA